MGHVTAAIEQQCRICKATAPKDDIKDIKKEQSIFFLINYVSNEKICTKCTQKYHVFKQIPFEEIKGHFGFALHEKVEDVSYCQPQYPCSYCYDKMKWRSEVEAMPKDKRSGAEKGFFANKIAEACPSVALVPLKINKKLVDNVFRIEYRLKKRDWVYCKPCESLLSYFNSSSRSVTKHLQSKQHCKKTEYDDDTGPRFNAPIQEMAVKQITNEQIIAVRQTIAETFAAKLSPYYLTSPSFEDALKRLFAIFGYHMPDNRSLTGSRRTLTRLTKEKAEKIKERVIEDLSIAQTQNSHLVISTDDGSLSNGNRENYRTWNITWVDAAGQVNSRYLTSWDDTRKRAQDLKDSLERVKAEFKLNEYENYSLCTDGASSNIKFAELDGQRQLNLCGPHGLNNAADSGIKELSNQNSEFKELNRLIKDFSSKASRRKYNQKFSHNEAWIKLKSIAETRWDSTCTVLEAIIHNFDILKNNNVNHPLIQDYPKELLQEYYYLLAPLRDANREMQLTTRTSGHLVALKYHSLLVHFLDYSSISTQPPMMKQLAQQLAKELTDRMDNTDKTNRKQQRVNLDRLLQTVFYPGSGFLGAFSARKLTNPENQKIIDDRVRQYETQIQTWAKEKSCQSSTSSVMDVSQTRLEFQIQSYVQLVSRLHDTDQNTTLPQVLVDFQANEASQKDANALFWTSTYARDFLPDLSAEILKLLPIPASTSLSEGTFSVANQIRNPKRSTITTQNLNYLLTCHYSRLLCPQNYIS